MAKATMGPMPENAIERKKAMRYICQRESLLDRGLGDVHKETLTLYLNWLNQAMNGKMLPARPVKKHRPRNACPTRG
jgi:hypothetical protein